MEIVFEKYGKAILVILVFVAMGGIIIAALASDGYVATAFKDALAQFFTDMSGLQS
jgi:hypothetical protein